jgi:hypothetical protein
VWRAPRAGARPQRQRAPSPAEARLPPECLRMPEPERRAIQPSRLQASGLRSRCELWRSRRDGRAAIRARRAPCQARPRLPPRRPPAPARKSFPSADGSERIGNRPDTAARRLARQRYLLWSKPAACSAGTFRRARAVCQQPDALAELRTEHGCFAKTLAPRSTASS